MSKQCVSCGCPESAGTINYCPSSGGHFFVEVLSLQPPKIMHVTGFENGRAIACPLCVRGELCTENANLVNTTLKAENDRLRFDLNHLAAKAKDVLKTGLPIDHEPNCECVVCLNHFLLVEKLEALEAK